MADGTPSTVLIGRITAAHGVRGWLKLKSFTDPTDNILHYKPWLFADAHGHTREVEVLDLQRNGANFIAKVKGCEDRNAAELFKGTEIRLSSDALPAAEEGEYYWDELIGLEVINVADVVLGTVRGLLETGAKDVLIVKNDEAETLVPFAEPYLHNVDLDAGRITVDWQADWLWASNGLAW